MPPQKLQMPASQGRVGLKPNGKHHHVCVIAALVCNHLGHLAILPLKRGNRLPKAQLHPVGGKVLRHTVAKIPVIITGKAGFRQINQPGFPAVTDKSLHQLHADIAPAHHRDILNVRVGEFFHNSFRVLEQLDKLDVFQVHPWDIQPDGQGTSGKDEFVVGLADLLAIFPRRMDSFPGKVNGVHCGFQVDGCPFTLKLLWGSIKQPTRAADLAADPQGHAAAQKADVIVLVKHSDFFLGIIVQDGVDRGSASVVSSNHYKIHSRSLFSKNRVYAKILQSFFSKETILDRAKFVNGVHKLFRIYGKN